MKSNNTLFAIGTLLIIIGAILKITHTMEPWNSWIFSTGIVLGLINSVFKWLKTRTTRK
jgi:hypothetical protein